MTNKIFELLQDNYTKQRLYNYIQDVEQATKKFAFDGQRRQLVKQVRHTTTKIIRAIIKFGTFDICYLSDILNKIYWSFVDNKTKIDNQAIIDHFTLQSKTIMSDNKIIAFINYV